MGTTHVIPCPPGSFGNLTNAEKIEDCHPCPAGTFNHLPAQTACFPCGSSSTSPAGFIISDVPRLSKWHKSFYLNIIILVFLNQFLSCHAFASTGSSSCTCIGKNRAFQHSDGSCLCRTGFIFYNELDFKSFTSDSELDCQPEVSIALEVSNNLLVFFVILIFFNLPIFWWWICNFLLSTVFIEMQ